jgi:hypothetical protein
MEELLEDIQTFLNQINTTVDEEQEYQRILEEFYQIPSYVERFKRREEAQDA